MRSPTHPRYPTRCGWNALLPPREPRPALSGDARVRYLVIGAGFTGLAAARRLAELEPEAAILVLDADEVGEGSSGRNSGFLLDVGLGKSGEPAAIRAASRLSAFYRRGLDWLGELVERHGIACELERIGTYRAAATPRGEVELRGYLPFLDGAGIAYRPYDRAGLQRRLGTAHYRFGFHTEGCTMVQPAALIRGLADSLPAGITLAERTPVTRLVKGRPWQAHTPHGTVRADTVVLANNGFVKSLGYLASRLVVIYTYAGITPELSERELAALGEDPAWGVLPAHRLGTTLRRCGRRFLVRSLYAYERELDNARGRAALSDSFRRRYPQLGRWEFEHFWGGTTAYTHNGSPWWGRLDEGLYASTGCNGGGVVKGSILGRLLAERIVGLAGAADPSAAFGQASWIPPEPLRTVGFHVAAAIGRRRAGDES